MSAAHLGGGRKPDPPATYRSAGPNAGRGSWGTTVTAGFVLLAAVVLMIRVGKYVRKERPVDTEIVPIEIDDPVERESRGAVRAPNATVGGTSDDTTRVWASQGKTAVIELDASVPAVYRNSTTPEVRMLGWLIHHCLRGYV